MRNRWALFGVLGVALAVTVLLPVPIHADGYSRWKAYEDGSDKWWECLYVYATSCGGADFRRVVVYPANDPRAGWAYFYTEGGKPLGRVTIAGNPKFDPKQPLWEILNPSGKNWDAFKPKQPGVGPFPRGGTSPITRLPPDVPPGATPQPGAKPQPGGTPQPDGTPKIDPDPATPDTPIKARFTGEHRLRVFDVPAGTKKLQIWFWLPMETPIQKVLSLRMKESPEVCRMVTDNQGNRYLYVEVSNPGPEVAIAYDFEVVSSRVESKIFNLSGIRYEPDYRKLFGGYLDTTPASGLRLTKLVEDKTREVVGDETDPIRIMRRIFDYSSDLVHYLRPSNLKKDQDDPSRVFSTVEDDQSADINNKAGTSDGVIRDIVRNRVLDTPDAGDAEYCINKGGGGCTDIHALVLAMARLKGIPSRHLFGSRVNRTKAGTPYKPGYQCMVEFYVPGHGWLPMNPVQAGNESDGKKPEDAVRIKAAHFGGMDVDRINFFEGRNVILGTGVAGEEGHKAGLFIGAVVLADGQTFKKFERTFNLKP